MDVTFVSLFSNPTASRYGSADRLFRTRRARRSVMTNLPVASTVKSVHSPTTTAALPSPKWLRSTRPAADSQSGTDSDRLRLIEWPARHSSSAPRSSLDKIASLLIPENDNFLIIFGNLVKEFFRIQ